MHSGARVSLRLARRGLLNALTQLYAYTQMQCQLSSRACTYRHRTCSSSTLHTHHSHIEHMLCAVCCTRKRNYAHAMIARELRDRALYTRKSVVAPNVQLTHTHFLVTVATTARVRSRSAPFHTIINHNANAHACDPLIVRWLRAYAEHINAYERTRRNMWSIWLKWRVSDTTCSVIVGRPP